MEETVIVSMLNNTPASICGYELTVKQKIWLHYIFPGICFMTVFVLNFSLDLGVAIDLLFENRHFYGLYTLLLIYLPPLGFYLHQLFHPPSQRDWKITTLWLLKETGLLVFFPYRLIKWSQMLLKSCLIFLLFLQEYIFSQMPQSICLGVQLFWIIEIIRDEEEQEALLLGYDNCFSEPMATYLFLQIFLQNIPQAFWQFHMITIGVSTYYETDIFQVACSIVSLAMAAINITTLHRYESQRLGGRKPIWKMIDALSPTPPTINEHVNLNQDYLLPEHTRLQLPERRPRIKALEEDNPIGKCFLFLFWWTFLIARTITIATAFQFYPKIVVAIVLVHIVMMYLYYTWYPISASKIIFLSTTSIFFILEVGIKIKKIAYLYLLFIITTLVEDMALSILWYMYGNWNEGWYNYIIYVDINAHILMLVFFAIYLAFFKPRVKYIRPHKNTLSNRSSIITNN